MAKIKQKIDEDMKQLITTVTGFEAGDENYDLCVSFAKSNFKYHRFMTPDSHKVERSVTGLCEKLEVHSQHVKSVALKELVDAFLGQSGLDGKDHGKTDVHYGMLSFLIELAESPTKGQFQKKVKQVIEEPVDTFDWYDYLVASEDLNFISYASSDSEDDEVETSSSDEDIGVKIVALKENPPEEGECQAATDDITTCSNVTHRSPSLTHVSTEHRDEVTQLEGMLMVQYWEGKSVEETSSGAHSNSNLIRDWNYYKKQMNEFDVPAAHVVVTEFQIIREALWMLSGVTDLFIFKHCGKEFSLNPAVYMLHLTTESLESLLRPLIRKANQVQTLMTFVSGLVSNTCQSEGLHSTPQTYQAFACSVSRFLSDFRDFLVEQEKQVMRQKTLMTLDRLASVLRPWLGKLQAVHNVYITGVAQLIHQQHKANNCVKATCLLNTLYDAVFESDLLTMVEEEGNAKLLLQMLISCSEPLLRIASDWVNYGQLMDPAEEFVLHRNTDIKSLDETFWEKAFVSNFLPSEAAMSVSDSTSMFSNDNKTENTDTTKNSELMDSSLYPKFLRSILGKVILTGKSMEMLENLGRMGEALEIGTNLFERPLSLYHHCLRELQNKFGSNHSLKEQKSNQQQENKTPNLVSKQLLRKGEKDTLLHLNFSALFSQESKNQSSQDCNVDYCHFESSTVMTRALRVCEASMEPYVSSRYMMVCSRLLHILKSEYHLVECIQAMQRYFLMGSGEVMYQFYTEVFHKIQQREMWRDQELLEMYLQEAVDSRYPNDSAQLTVNLVSSKPGGENAISATDCIRLKYQVPWPVDVVISSSCQQHYNDIFNFLLQIKRSKFMLDQLRFEDLSSTHGHFNEANVSSAHPMLEEENPMPYNQRLHRLHLLKFRLLYFVNGLHNYMMTRILHSSGLEFSEQLHSATDLEQVISIHRSYVNLIHDRCLLHPRLTTLKKALCQVLSLSLTLSAQWRRGADLITGPTIIALEQELSRYVDFLSTFLNNVIKRGSFPHLESLAFALTSPIYTSS